MRALLLIIALAMMLKALGSNDGFRLLSRTQFNATDCPGECILWASTISVHGSVYLWTSRKELLFNIHTFEREIKFGPSINIVKDTELTSNSSYHRQPPYIIERDELPVPQEEWFYMAGTDEKELFLVGGQHTNTSKLVRVDLSKPLRGQKLTRTPFRKHFYAQRKIAFTI
jgi:hypothetical protein